MAADSDELFTPQETALLIVDMQNGFCHPESHMGRVRGTERQAAIIPAVAELVELAHAADIAVCWSKQIHFPNDVTRLRHRIASHTERQGFVACLLGTWEVDIVSPLAALVRNDDYVFVKHRSSCFYETSLRAALRMMGTRTLIVAGVNTNYCVESTIRDAYFRDYDIVVPPECIAGTDLELHAATLKNIERYFGVVMPLAELRTRLSPRVAALAR